MNLLLNNTPHNYLYNLTCTMYRVHKQVKDLFQSLGKRWLITLGQIVAANIITTAEPTLTTIVGNSNTEVPVKL